MATRKLLFTVLLGLAVLGASCSSGDVDDITADDDIATLADEETTGDSGDDSAEELAEDGDSEAEEATATAIGELTPEESALQFSECMRNEGISDFPDLGIDANGNIDLNDIPIGLQDNPGTQDAFDACQPLIEAGGFGERVREVVESPEFNDSLVDFSDCIRDEGFDVGDLTIVGLAGAVFGEPTPSEANPEGGDREEGFGDRDGIFATALGLDPDDPEVATAVNTCLPVVEGAMADLGFEQ